MRLLRNTLTLLAVLGLTAGTAMAQDSGVMIEVHGGIALPTSDIFVVDDVGPLVGAGIWYSPVDQRWALGAEADFGFQSDGKIYHFMGKAGYIVYTSQDGKLGIMLNGGAGVMILNVDEFEIAGFGTIDPDAETDFAINVGAKFMYMVSDQASIVVSPQSDIAFGETCESCDNISWVWPISAGVQIKI